MEVSPDLILRTLAQYPILLVAFYCFVWMLPRSMSIVLGVLTGLLIVFSLVVFPENHWNWLHSTIVNNNAVPSAVLMDTPEEYREIVERAFTKGVYLTLVLCAAVVVVVTPMVAKSRVNEAISNIGRRPPSGPKPML